MGMKKNEITKQMNISGRNSKKHTERRGEERHERDSAQVGQM